MSEASTATAIAPSDVVFSPFMSKDLVDFGGAGTECDLVLVLPDDFRDASYGIPAAPAIEVEPESEPEVHPEPVTQLENVGGATHDVPSTPEKKTSRLPVRMRSGLKVIKRISTTFSLSRSTGAEASARMDACATTMGPIPGMPGKGDVPGSGRLGVPTGPAGKVSAAGGGSTRIPMGRKLQRFGI